MVVATSPSKIAFANTKSKAQAESKAQADAQVERIVFVAQPPFLPDSYQAAETGYQKLAYLLSAPHESLEKSNVVLRSLTETIPGLLAKGFDEGDPTALLDIQKMLYLIYETSFSNPLSSQAQHENALWLQEIKITLEDRWFAFERKSITASLANPDLFSKPDSLARWFLAQAERQDKSDRHLVSFLAEKANFEQMRFFILADANLNYRFADALTLALHHFSEHVKHEISTHLWDECGLGNLEDAHTVKFTRTLEQLGLSLPSAPVWEDWRPYAGYNMYLAFGLSRRHLFKALGSLAMPELFDPDRDRFVVDGLNRLGFPQGSESYYASHIEGDEEHGPSWLNNVIMRVVEAQPEAGKELAFGAALRMEAMRRYNLFLSERFSCVD